MTRKANMVLLAFLLLIAFAIVPLATAQQTTASLSGFVRDQSGAILPNVEVSITQAETGVTRVVKTGADGHYFAPQLPIGEYRINVQAPGFQKQLIAGIRLQVGQQAVENVTLKVGQVTQEVQVSSEAPLVNTTSATLSGVVSTEQLNSLPLNGRDYMQLAKDQQGVLWYRSSATSQTTGIGARISVSGARDNQNLFLMDGTVINDVSNSTPGGASGTTLGVETIREFQILTNAYSAEYGRNGGGVVNVVTRSGTNAFHGTAYEFIRNSVFDAKDYFLTPGSPIQPFKRNQFGGMFGGPIKKNKTFFIANYEGLRERLGLTQTIRVPDANARNGIFATGGNVTVSPLVKPYLDLYPMPNGKNFGDGTAQFTSSPSQPTDENLVMGRVDQNWTDHDSSFVRYTFDTSSINPPDGAGLFANTLNVRNQYVTIQHQHIFSNSLLDTARFGFSRNFSNNFPTPLRSVDPSLSFIPGQYIGQIGVTPLSAIGTPTLGPRRFVYNVFDFQNHFEFTHGRHSLKIGGNVNRMQDNENSAFEITGNYSFLSLRNFLQDKANTIEVQLPGTDAIRGLRQWLFGMYIQDGFRVTPRLTLNMGLRYEFITVPTEVNGKLWNLRNILDPTTTQGPYFRNPSLKNFGPRFGLVWDPWGNGKTAIKAGGGIFYDEVTSVYTTLPATRQPPVFEQANLSNPPFPNILPALTGVKPLLRLNQINYNLTTPRSGQFNLSIQRELPAGLTFNVGYVGRLSRHLIVLTDESNKAIPTILPDGTEFFPAGLQRRNPNFGNIGRRSSDGIASYHGLQAGLNRRFSKGMLLQVSYTYSKNETDGDIVVAATSDDNAFTIVDPDHFQKGLSELNIKHNFVANFVADLPFGAGHALGGNAPRVVQAIIGGWQWNAITTFSSGQPFSVVLGFDQARAFTRSGGGGERPNLKPGCSSSPILGSVSQWFDPSCFLLPAVGTFGNLPPNTLIGPGLALVDTSIIRKFPLPGEGHSLEFRSEFFNVINHPNFDVPSSTTVFLTGGVLNSGAGTITRTVTKPRNIQFGLKFTF